MSIINVIADRIGRYYSDLVNRAEYEEQTFIAINERPVEFRFVFENLAELCPMEVLDVGTGRTALPSLIRNCGFLVTAIDNIKDFWPTGIHNRHFHVLNEDITRPTLKKRFDLISCISVIEHITDSAKAVHSMAGLLNCGGHLVLTFPYAENQFCRNVYEVPGSGAFGKDLSYTTCSYSRKELDSWCNENGLQIVKQEYWRYFTGSLWSVGERVVPPVRVSSSDLHQLTCVLLKKT